VEPDGEGLRRRRRPRVRAACPNLGLAVDAFDVLTARTPLDDLEAIDPEQIFLVQLSRLHVA